MNDRINLTYNDRCKDGDVASVMQEESLLWKCMNTTCHKKAIFVYQYPFAEIRGEMRSLWTKFTLWTKQIQNIQVLPKAWHSSANSVNRDIELEQILDILKRKKIS